MSRLDRHASPTRLSMSDRLRLRMARIPPYWREGLAAVGFWICIALAALFALYGRDVEALVRAWRLAP